MLWVGLDELWKGGSTGVGTGIPYKEQAEKASKCILIGLHSHEVLIV